MSNKVESLKILIAGEGGQGVKKLSDILAQVLFESEYNVVSTSHYGVEMRMGISMSFIKICQKDLAYPKFNKADILVVLTARDINLVKEFQGQDTVVINGIELEPYLTEREVSNKSLNMLVLGILVKKLTEYSIKLSPNLVKNTIREKLLKKGNIGHNIDAFNLGLALDKKEYSTPLERFKAPIFSPVIASDSKKEHVIFPNLCKGCGLCIEKCPFDALTWSNKTNFISQPIPKVAIDKCTACQTCQEFCPDAAIRVNKK